MNLADPWGDWMNESLQFRLYIGRIEYNQEESWQKASKSKPLTINSASVG